MSDLTPYQKLADEVKDSKGTNNSISIFVTQIDPQDFTLQMSGAGLWSTYSGPVKCKLDNVEIHIWEDEINDYTGAINVAHKALLKDDECVGIPYTDPLFEQSLTSYITNLFGSDIEELTGSEQGRQERDKFNGDLYFKSLEAFINAVSVDDKYDVKIERYKF